MQVIPVIDILNGVVVRGVGGERELYRPIQSTLTPSRDPSVILNVFTQRFGSSTFYVADLDSIQGRSLSRCTIAELSRGDTRLIVDRGVRCANDVEELLDLGVANVVVALETLPGVNVAQELVMRFGSESLVFSLDLRNGIPLASDPVWQQSQPVDVANELIDCGFKNIIVLDVSAVGMDRGTPTLELCRRLRPQLKNGMIITGGGVSSLDDLQAAKDCGVDGVLVASALHDRRISAENVRAVATMDLFGNSCKGSG